MSTTTEVASPQSASLVLSILQSKAGNRWGRAVEEMKVPLIHSVFRPQTQKRIAE